MKKAVRIIAIVLGVLILLMIATPFLFKSKIRQFVRNQVNQQVEATVEWERFSVSLIRGFPDLSVGLKGLTVTGDAPFEGDTIVSLEMFDFRVDLGSAISGDIVVEKIILDRPVIMARVLSDGTASYDIFPEGEEEVSKEEPEDEDGTAPSKGIRLKEFQIKGGRLIYRDAPAEMEAQIEDFNLLVRGDFSMDQTDMYVNMLASGLSAQVGGVSYVKQGELMLDLHAAADLVNNLYRLKKNEIRFNGLTLGADGEVLLMDNGDMAMDLRYYAREARFRTLLGLVPAVYMEDFAGITTRGSLELEGTVIGTMTDSLLPDVTLNLGVSEGYFSYTDLPGEVSDITIDLKADFNGTTPDNTTVDLNRLYFLAAGNPFEMGFHLATPMSDLRVKGNVNGVIDFSQISDIVPLEGIRLAGLLETDLSLDTRMSYIEQEQYEEVNAKGSLSIAGMELHTEELPQTIRLDTVSVTFSPRYVNMDRFDVKIGESDIQLNGRLEKFIPYVFNDETVYGSLQVSSSYLDLNPFLRGDTTAIEDDQEVAVATGTDSVAVDTSEAVPVKIPRNLNLSLNLDLKELHYEELLVENIEGSMELEDGKASLENLSLELLEGIIIATGDVDTRDDLPYAAMSLDMKGIDISSSYETFMTVETLAPMAKYCQGTMEADIEFNTTMNNDLTPVYETINSSGRIRTENLRVYNTQSFVRISELLKNDKFRQFAPDELNIAYTIRDGRVIVQPFDVKVENSRMRISGSHGIDQSLDYVADMQIARTDLGAGTNEVISGLSALAGSAGLQLPESDYLEVKARITGYFEDPRITTDLPGLAGDGGSTVREQVEDKAREKVEEVGDEAREKASAEAERIISEAEEEADRIMKKADQAGRKLVEEARKKGAQLTEDAGNNPLKKIAAQKAAEELVNQAERQSENLKTEARKRADRILENARAEAEKINK